MKKILIAISFVCGCVINQGCSSDFLEHEIYGPSSDWSSEDDILAAAASMYEFMTLESTGGRGPKWFDACSDNEVLGRTRASAQAIRDFEISSSYTDDCNEIWAVFYQSVARANALMVLIPTLDDLSTSFANQKMGESYFIRGFAMLSLAPYFGDNVSGGIPIILDTTPTDEIDAPRPSSVTKNYDQIISDFKTAAELLPYFSELDPATEYGLPHKAAAWGFAARAALYAAQYNSSYYDTVITMCDNIINLTGSDARGLFDDGTSDAFANLWTADNNFCEEYLWSMLGSASEMDGPVWHGIGFQNAGWSLYNCWGYFQPTLELYKAYEAGDERRDATILYPDDRMLFMGCDVWFGGYTSDYRLSSTGSYTTSKTSKTWSIASQSGMTFRKFMDPWKYSDASGKSVSSNGNNMTNELGTCLLRYADVLLMKAEALIWSKGEGNADAVALLNQIRKRAGLAEDSTATKAQLKSERRCELAYEFQPSRHIDLVRWGDAQTTYAQTTGGVDYTYNSSAGTVTATEMVWEQGRTFDPTIHHVFPIPDSAFEGSVNLTQNYGYY